MSGYYQDVLEAAQAEIRRRIREVEDDQNSLRIGKVRVADNTQDVGKRRAKGVRFKLPPDMSYPTPLVDRPRTIDDHCSFHFAQTSVSKGGVPTVRGEPAPYLYKAASSAAVAHQKYIERDGAAEHSLGADHAAYIERDGAIEGALNSELSAALEARLEAAERARLGPTVRDTGLVPSVFSNISEDQWEREEYWRAVERCERSARTHYLAFDPYASPAWWNNLETGVIFPPKLLKHSLEIREAREAHDRLSPDHDRERYRAEDLAVSADEAGDYLTSIVTDRHVDPGNRPARFKPGRSGRIQYRLIAELPFELTPEERAQIVRGFTDLLRKKGLMYTAVIHAPNAQNDVRNYHVHVIYNDRPATFLEDRACWDFEVTEEVKDASGKRRVRFPLKQPKVLAVAQSASKSGDQESGKKFIRHLRGEYARITNTVLKNAGLTKRYDPRRYDEMGIKRTPTEHLGKKDAALEAIGVPTKRGTRNAISIWRDAEKAIDDQFMQVMKEHAQRQNEYERVLSRATGPDVDKASVDQLKSLIAARATIIDTTIRDRYQLMRFDLSEKKAKSRAVKTRQTCSQLLTSIQDGTGDKTTKANFSSLTERLALAESHIDGIDAELEKFRAPLAAFAKVISEHEESLAFIDEAAPAIAKRIQAPSVVRTRSPALSNASGLGGGSDHTGIVPKQPVPPITIVVEQVVSPNIRHKLKAVPVQIEAIEDDREPFAETIRAVQPNKAHVGAVTPAPRGLSPAARDETVRNAMREPNAREPDETQIHEIQQTAKRIREIEDAEHRRRRRYDLACSKIIRGYNQQHAEAHPGRSSAGNLSSMRKLPRGDMVRDGNHPAMPLLRTPPFCIVQGSKIGAQRGLPRCKEFNAWR